MGHFGPHRRDKHFSRTLLQFTVQRVERTSQLLWWSLEPDEMRLKFHFRSRIIIPFSSLHHNLFVNIAILISCYRITWLRWKSNPSDWTWNWFSNSLRTCLRKRSTAQPMVTGNPNMARYWTFIFAKWGWYISLSWKYILMFVQWQALAIRS